MRVEFLPAERGYAIRIVGSDYTGEIKEVAKAVEFGSFEEGYGAEVPRSTFLGIREAQDLLDSLWRCGLRPSFDESKSTEACLKSHINDLRQVLFVQMGIQ